MTLSIEQIRKLRDQLEYLQANSPFYREVFSVNEIDISEIHAGRDLEKIPVTTKDDIQGRNWDFLCVPRNRIAEYCTTSGTMGMPVTLALTNEDLDRLAENEFRSFRAAGAGPDDVFQFMLSLDRQFMAGIAYYLGVRKTGAGLVRVGPGNAHMQLDAIRRFNPTILIAVPSFLVTVIKAATEAGFDLASSSVKKVICIGENIRNEDFTLNALGARIRKDWKVELYSTYASTEMQTAFTECSYGRGGHHLEDLLIYEIVDENNRQLEPGNAGELVITTLGVKGMPLLRYKTGDICVEYTETCSCGNKSARLSPILGRKQQMIKYNGTTLFPQNIFNVLNTLPEIEDYVVLLSGTEFGTDDLKILVASEKEEGPTKKKLSKLLQSSLRISPSLDFTSVKEIQQIQLQEGKRKLPRFIDKRIPASG
jgi:phenylacetate-CoA ligase